MYAEDLTLHSYAIAMLEIDIRDDLQRYVDAVGANILGTNDSPPTDERERYLASIKAAHAKNIGVAKRELFLKREQAAALSDLKDAVRGARGQAGACIGYRPANRPNESMTWIQTDFFSPLFEMRSTLPCTLDGETYRLILTKSTDNYFRDPSKIPYELQIYTKNNKRLFAPFFLALDGIRNRKVICGKVYYY